MTVWVAMMEGMAGSFVLGVYDSEELAKNALAHCNEICKKLNGMVDPITYYFHTDMNSAHLFLYNYHLADHTNSLVPHTSAEG